MIFRFSGTLLRFVNFQKEIAIESATVTEGIETLVNREPQLQPILKDSSGALRSTHRMFLNGEMMTPADMTRPIGERDCVDILTAIAGG